MTALRWITEGEICQVCFRTPIINHRARQTPLAAVIDHLEVEAVFAGWQEIQVEFRIARLHVRIFPFEPFRAATQIDLERIIPIDIIVAQGRADAQTRIQFFPESERGRKQAERTEREPGLERAEAIEIGQRIRLHFQKRRRSKVAGRLEDGRALAIVQAHPLDLVQIDLAQVYLPVLGIGKQYPVVRDGGMRGPQRADRDGLHSSHPAVILDIDPGKLLQGFGRLLGMELLQVGRLQGLNRCQKILHPSKLSPCPYFHRMQVLHAVQGALGGNRNREAPHGKQKRNTAESLKERKHYVFLQIIQTACQNRTEPRLPRPRRMETRSDTPSGLFGELVGKTDPASPVGIVELIGNIGAVQCHVIEYPGCQLA